MQIYLTRELKRLELRELWVIEIEMLRALMDTSLSDWHAVAAGNLRRVRRAINLRALARMRGAIP